MTISTGKQRVRVFRSALRDVKYLKSGDGKVPMPWTGHDDAIRHRNQLHEDYSNPEKYNYD